ncbi:MAG: pilus assembly protein PilP [Deltaproteobacteria bacterium]|nr:pilus assembly protein PilP [Deltaproteobacteria bacterium]
MLKPCKYIFKKVFYISVACALFTCYSSGVETKPDTDEKILDEAQVFQGENGADKKARKYIYDPSGKTDPFKPFIVTQEEKAAKEKEKPKTYLETLELSQISLTVIVIGENSKWAMVKDSKDDGHVIKEGTPIGTNGGVVHKIQPGEVVIREEFINFRGEKDFRDVSKRTVSDQE